MSTHLGLTGRVSLEGLVGLMSQDLYVLPADRARLEGRFCPRYVNIGSSHHGHRRYDNHDP
jgi:hypothetical protein